MTPCRLVQVDETDYFSPTTFKAFPLLLDVTAPLRTVQEHTDLSNAYALRWLLNKYSISLAVRLHPGTSASISKICMKIATKNLQDVTFV